MHAVTPKVHYIYSHTSILHEDNVYFSVASLATVQNRHIRLQGSSLSHPEWSSVTDDSVVDSVDES